MKRSSSEITLKLLVVPNYNAWQPYFFQRVFNYNAWQPYCFQIQYGRHFAALFSYEFIPAFFLRILR